MVETKKVWVVSSVWTTVSYGDTTKTEEVFADSDDAIEFIHSFAPEQQNMAASFVSMRIEAVKFVDRKE